MSKHLFGRLALLATLLGLGVVVLGAYVRLSDAGLGCPDWPGCYGHLVVPSDEQLIAKANAAFPDRPVEPEKGWKEMIHRYFASALGLLILALAVLAWRWRHRPRQQLALPLLLVGVVIFQGLLGMWTVTWQLKPVVVMAHLLGGLTTVGLLWWVTLRDRCWFQDGVAESRSVRALALLALVIVVAQIALGGWTSANYAALACTDFPTCHGEWWPKADFGEGFVLWRGLGVNYEFGVLDNPARVAIQLTHRIGAVITLIVVLALAVALLLRAAGRTVRRVAAVAAVLVLAQFGLGVSNVLLSLPLPVAVAHNAGAALLFLALVTLNHTMRPLPAAAARRA